LLVGPIYWAVFRWLPGGWTLLAALGLVNLMADFTMVRLVVEDRRSVLGAVAAAWRFIRRRVFRVVALYLVSVAFLITLPANWVSAVSTVTGPALSFVSVYVLLLVRTWLLLAWTASEIVFFQRELAHAHYTAAPMPSWPDSPAVEAIENLTRRARAAGTIARDGRDE
jgi:hypothetical protein